jgi:UDP-N-acetylglucosamine/UDP-N-acetylgalactosamine diphosphorylase
VGYGAITGAGQVLRRDVPEGHLVVEAAPEVDMAYRPPGARQAEQVRRRNVEYLAQLEALRAWYRRVRLARVSASGPLHLEAVTAAAAANVDACIAERWQRLEAFLAERGLGLAPLHDLEVPPPPLDVSGDGPSSHVAWVQGLPPTAVEAGRAWLESVASLVRDQLRA